MFMYRQLNIHRLMYVFRRKIGLQQHPRGEMSVFFNYIIYACSVADWFVFFLLQFLSQFKHRKWGQSLESHWHFTPSLSLSQVSTYRHVTVHVAWIVPRFTLQLHTSEYKWMLVEQYSLPLIRRHNIHWIDVPIHLCTGKLFRTQTYQCTKAGLL